jgi:hypothetical protein
VNPRFQLRQLVTLLVVACLLAGAGIYWSRARRAARPSDLVGYLPTGNASVVYIDVDALRRSGILDLMAGGKTSGEPDYQQFVNETKFDYRQDLDSAAVAFQDGKTYFALRGRFHWNDLSTYALRQGGSCHNDFCVLTGSQPNRRISFYPLKSDVLAMAVGPDDFAAYQVAKHSGQAAFSSPKDPVWALIPATALGQMSSLPEAAKAYVPALRDAEQIVFSIAPTADRQMQFGAQVTCKDSQAASALVTQLETITKALRELVTHQSQKPDPSDLSAVLVAGTFRRDERRVYGAWPIPRAFVDAIAGTMY